MTIFKEILDNLHVVMQYNDKGEPETAVVHLLDKPEHRLETIEEALRLADEYYTHIDKMLDDKYKEEK